MHRHVAHGSWKERDVKSNGIEPGSGAAKPVTAGTGGALIVSPKAKIVSPTGVQAVTKEKYIGPHSMKPVHTINDLVGRSAKELEALMRSAKEPNLAEFQALFLRPQGLSGLALHAPDHDYDELGKAIRSVMLFKPWKGKRAYTAPNGATEGTGKNFILGMELAPFRWNLVESKLDPKIFGTARVIRLDYSSPKGWGPYKKSLFNTLTGIREIWDEMKEVAPGVYLGMAAFQPADPPNQTWTNIYNNALAYYGRPERLGDKCPVPGIFFVLGIKDVSELEWARQYVASAQPHGGPMPIMLEGKIVG
jgi:hypothetical protein